MSAQRTISVLEKNNIMLGVFTNNLAAFEKLKQEFPSSLQVHLPSYSKVNRHVAKNGDSIDIATPLGIYVIKKTVLLKKGI